MDKWDILYRLPATNNGLTPFDAAQRFAAEYWQEPREVEEMHLNGEHGWRFTMVGGGDYFINFDGGYLVIWQCGSDEAVAGNSTNAVPRFTDAEIDEWCCEMAISRSTTRKPTAIDFYRAHGICPVCRGKSYFANPEMKCPWCNGTGLTFGDADDDAKTYNATVNRLAPGMPFEYDDGGRKEAGYKGSASDCVARAIAIATGLPYTKVHDRLAAGTLRERKMTKSRKTISGKYTADHGIHTTRKWFKDYMRELGFTWTPTMAIGSGCKVHLKTGELPAGRLVVACSKHYVAVIDGVVRDTGDVTRDGTRCVYGYWTLNKESGR